jgi:phenylacetate-coenzyme A ligase PaaK-like adenylate-forming protein
MTDYETTRQRHIQDMLEGLGEHLERLNWSAERLRAERTERLRELVAVAKEHSAWHAKRLADIDPQMLDEDHLRELPVMTKSDLMENFDAIVTEPRVTLAKADAHIAALSSDRYFLGDLHAVASGGSSGVRGVFVWSWTAWATAQRSLLRRQLSDRLRDAELASKPPVAMFVGAENATHYTSALAQTFTTPAVAVHRFPVTLPLEEIVAGLNRVSGDSLAAYPSMLATLVSEARAGRLTIAPRRVVTMAEPLLPEIRAAAEATWGAPIANLWGTSEGGVTAFGCFQDPGMHLCDDLLIVEPVDAEGNPVAPGIRSHAVYLTNLFNSLQPLIRYEITDEVTIVDEPCACGSAHRRIADIQGRNDDVFVYPGGLSVHPHVFRSVLARLPEITEYQVRQTGEGAEVLLRAADVVDVQCLADDLETALRRSGHAQPAVSARAVDTLPRGAVGKLKRFVPLRAAE